MPFESSVRIRYWDITWSRVWAELLAESSRTYIGFFWWILEPALSLLIYYFVFAVVLGTREEHYVAFLLVGLVAWRWFNTGLSHGAGSIARERQLMNQVYLPKVLFPLQSVLGDSVKFFWVLLILFAFLWLSGFGPSIAYFSLPLLFLVEFLFLFGLTCIVAGLLPFFPDIQVILDSSLRLLFFLSGVVIDLKKAPEPFRSVLELNPIAIVIDGLRGVLIRSEFPDLYVLGVAGLFSVLVSACGMLLIRRNEFEYPRIA